MTDVFDPRKIRIASGHSQVEAANFWGVAQSTLSRWEETPSSMKKYQRNLYLSLEPKVEVAE